MKFVFHSFLEIALVSAVALGQGNSTQQQDPPQDQARPQAEQQQNPRPPIQDQAQQAVQEAGQQAEPKAGQQPGTSTQGGESAQPLNDKEFAIKAMTSGHKEVNLSELAETRSRNSEVKEFAQKMIQDHRKGNEKLMAQARDLKIGVVTGLEKDTRDHYERLAKLEGDAFDQAYMKQMVEDHMKAVAMFSAQARAEGHFSRLAQEMLPTLQMHLKHAQHLHDKLHHHHQEK